MATILDASTSRLEGEQRVIIRGVGWKGYETLLDLVGDQPIRLTYDRGDVELMSPRSKHERTKSIFARMVEILTEELDIPMMSAGSSTLKREELDRGLEPDECFYLHDLDRLGDPDDLDMDVDPPPDLVIEIEISLSVLSRLGVYGALRVPEIWRFDGRGLRILERQADGTYLEISRSKVLPWISNDEILHFVLEEDTRNESKWARKFRDWVRAVVLPRAQMHDQQDRGLPETGAE
jgi:Uma2 family endonuclease